MYNSRTLSGTKRLRLHLLATACAVFVTSHSSVEAQPFFKEGVPVVPGTNGTAAPAPLSALPAFSPLVRELSPGVVNISVEADVMEEGEELAPNNPLPGFPFFKPNPNAPSPSRSLGSGFIVSEDGYIVTNNHVIKKADKIVVRLLDDKTSYTATVRGIDEKTDLALIKITPKQPLKSLFLGNSDELEVGDWVLAIGNQFQLGQSVTAGIVSAKSRKLPSVHTSPYDAFIQTDASINPGSSGGPLFNTRGQVIGINTAIFSPGHAKLTGSGFNIGIGFAIPINLAKNVITQLKERQRVTRGLLGVMIQRIDEDLAAALGLPSPDGALVAEVMKGTPADLAGFKRRDIIVRYNGKPVSEHDDLPLMVANTPVGTTADIEVLRGGKRETLKAKIVELEDKGETVKTGDAPKDQPKPNAMGLILEDLDPETQTALRLQSTEGVVVQAVEPASIAERAGVARGDVIEELANQKVSNVAAFNKIYDSLPAEKPVLMLVRKSEGSRFLTFRKR